eukprot:COSAG01_NODE_69821_length_260_cov_0.645963_1_plen_35_part_01
MEDEDDMQAAGPAADEEEVCIRDGPIRGPPRTLLG